MKIYYESDRTYVVAQNKVELMDYLLRVDCNSENPVRYSATLATSVNNHPILVVDINKYHTSVSFPLVIADGVKTDCITRQYDSLETFRYNLKNFFEYIETIAKKVEKEKEYVNLLKKLTITPKPPKESKTKTEPDEDEMGCKTYVEYWRGIPLLHKQYYYLNKEKKQ